jgi:hypothetical protein
MSGIDAYTLEPYKTYNFSLHYNLLLNKDDKIPHYYEATYISRKGTGKKKTIWVFKKFTDTETGEISETQEIKHLGLLNPTFELIT